MIMIKKIVKQVYKNYGVSCRAFGKTLLFNYLKAVEHNNAIIVAHPESQLRIDEDGKIVLDAPLYIGRSVFKYDGLSARILINERGIIQVLGQFVMHNGAFIHIRQGGKLILHGGYINWGCNIVCEGTIEIGEDCAIAPNVMIRSCDSHQIVGHESESVKNIKIGNHVWIGQNAAILKGVTIGNGAIIGSNSVVTKDIPAHCIAVGNPAKVIRENVEWK